MESATEDTDQEAQAVETWASNVEGVVEVHTNTTTSRYEASTLPVVWVMSIGKVSFFTEASSQCCRLDVC